MARKRKKYWSHSVGPYGSRIRLFEDAESGILYAETRDPSLRSGYRAMSLRHRDRDRAVEWAKRQVLKLEAGDEALRDPTPTLARVLGLYRAERTPKKSASEQSADKRRSELWARVLGPKKDLRRLTLAEWTRFIDARSTGAIDSHGCAVRENDRQPVRNGTVAADLIYLKTVLNWAVRWQDPHTGRYLLASNPVRGFPMPRELNPRRPVVTSDRYERVLAAATELQKEREARSQALSERYHLPDLLVVAFHTGRRISAVVALRYEDLRLSDGPHGAIRWPADTDKMGKEWIVPVSPEVREVLDKILLTRPGIARAWLFPSARTASKHVSKDVASAWLLKAERRAKVPKQTGSLWHAYRRGWATSRKHMPDVDVAAAGGWSDTSSLKQCYQHADPETMYKVVSQPREIRKA